MTALGTPDAKGKTKIAGGSADAIIKGVIDAETCIRPDEPLAGA